MVFNFTVRGDKITPDKDYRFIEGNKGSYEAVFDFGEEWEELGKLCVVRCGDKKYTTLITADSCLLPEFVKNSAKIGVVGCVSLDGAALTTRISTNMLTIGVESGAYDSETAEEFSTAAQVWEQYLSEMESSRRATEAASEAAENARAAAETARQGASSSETSAERHAGNAKEGAEAAEAAAKKAQNFAESVSDMTVSVETLNAGEAPTVEKGTDGKAISLKFGIPKGEKGDNGYTPQKGVDYFTSTEKNELVNSVFNVLKGMDGFGNVSFINNSKVTLCPGRVYAFESVGDTYKVQLYDQDGNIQSQIDEAMGGIIIYPSSGLAKYISMKEKPSSIGLTDLLNFQELFDKLLETATFNVNTEKPNIYIETVDNHKFYCWEIAGNSHDLQIGTYAARELIKGITAELSVSFLYPLEFDEYAVAIDGVEIERQSYGGTMRIAAELLKAKDTQIVFYKNGEEIIKARVQPTILNCGMLYAIER